MTAIAARPAGGLSGSQFTISAFYVWEDQLGGASKTMSDLTDLEQRKRELSRLSRLYAAQGQINHAVIQTHTREELFERVCDALVAQGEFRAAWIGWYNPQTHQLEPVASRGDESGYLERVRIFGDDRPEGRGPTGRAFVSGQSYICNDITSDPATLPWRSQMKSHGWYASAAFPVRLAGEACATLTIYAEETDFFQAKEISLLSEAADVISFALDNFAREDRRRQAEEAVRAERDFSEALISALPGVFYLYEPFKPLVQWNKNVQRALGYSAEEIGSLISTDLIAEADRDRTQAATREVLATGETVVEAHLRSKDGQLTPYHLTGVLLELSGKKYVVGVGINTTKRNQAELARQAAEDAMRDTQLELARVARISVLGEFAASVAHEINQPLAAITTNSGAAIRWMAKNPPDFEAAKQALVRIARDATRASDVVSRLRGLVTRQTPEYVNLALTPIVDEVLAFTHGALRRAGIDVHLEMADGLPPIHGDHIQLLQVMINLVTNAIDAMKPVMERQRVLRITTGTAESGDVLVEVADCGIGLDPETTERIFDHFFTTKTGGTGLGLAISRTIVEGHRGALWAMPGTPYGAIFRFTIPPSSEPEK